MKKEYLSPEWKLIVLMSDNILITSDDFEIDPDDPYTKDY